MTRIVFISLVVFINSLYVYAQTENINIYTGICINEQEQDLLEQINKYRAENALDPIPLSASLCYVAQTHVKDLYLNKPQRGNCSLHSWSGKGRWSECCYRNSMEDGNCMFEKPAELTGYKSQAYEVIYYENKAVRVETVVDFWKSSYKSQSILLNQATWENYNWKAIGVGIFENYVSVWFGEASEQEREVILCETEELLTAKVDTIHANDQPRFYLIVYSFKRREDAIKRLERLRRQGYTVARLLVQENNYRVAIKSFSTMGEAEKMRKKLKNKYSDAWVFKK